MTEPMNLRRLGDLVASIGRPRILVAGEAILDEYVWGEVERISPEAPIPVLRVNRREHRVGGAGSVVMNLLKLGAEVRFLSTVGGDEKGRAVLDFLRRAGANVGGVVAAGGQRTIVKARHLGYVQHANRAVQQLLRVDEEDLVPPEPEVLATLSSMYEKEVRGAAAVLISDYQKGLLTRGFLRRLIEGAGSVPVLIDPGRTPDYSIYRGASLICPNRYETSLATNLPCQRVEESGPAARKLIREHGIGAVAVTLDRDGIYLETAAGIGKHFPTKATVVADVTGAGDMVLSVLGLVMAGGGDVEDAVRLANVAAGIEIRRLGVVPIGREEILAELRFEGHPGAGKLKTLPEVVGKVAELRAQNKRVVFTNGCFDLLHFGHHRLLNEARRQGDFLIVAVNSDRSIRRLKGSGRPIYKEEERMLMLSGLESVDCVLVFEEDTPIPLLEAIRPDILVKGSEYKDGVVVGRELVESYGGRVHLVEQVPGISTTAILQREN